jgi:UTP--glucose-1-phosphate uridylyltransferase
VRVPRSRFAAVKNTGDLLGVRSDAYVLTRDFRVVPNPARTLGTPVVTLDARWFAFIDQLEERFPYGPPSLLECERLEVVGDVRFGPDVRIKGRARIVNDSAAQLEIAAGTIVSGEDAVARPVYGRGTTRL